MYFFLVLVTELYSNRDVLVILNACNSKKYNIFVGKICFQLLYVFRYKRMTCIYLCADFTFYKPQHKTWCVFVCPQDRCFSVLCVRRGSACENNLQFAELQHSAQVLKQRLSTALQAVWWPGGSDGGSVLGPLVAQWRLLGEGLVGPSFSL